MERRAAPGGGGQGRRPDQGREPDARHRHAAELLPHVRQARRHDRYRVHGGGRVRAHLQPAGRARSRRTSRWSAPTTPTTSTRPPTRSTPPSSRTSSNGTRAGQPVLVGTISVEQSEQLSRMLQQRGVPHDVLNAKQHEREANIITQAGKLHARHRRDEHGRPRRRHPPRRQPRRPRQAGVRPRGPRPRRPEQADEFERRYERAAAEVRGGVQGRGRQGPRARRPLRARHRTPRVAPHRQPAARPFRPPGRPGREPLLPVARRRAHAPVRHRPDEPGDGRGVPRRRAARSEDGLEGDRARAAHRRGPQLRDPQERPQVRRGDERAAQGHLQAPPADPRRRGPAARKRSRRSRQRSAA